MVTITDGSGSRIKVPGLGGFDGVFKRLSKNAPGELEYSVCQAVPASRSISEFSTIAHLT